MKLEECFKRTDRYLRSNDTHVRLINVVNSSDMNEIISNFNVGNNVFMDVCDFAKDDENPSESQFLNQLQIFEGSIFITGFTSYYKLLGEKKLRNLLVRLMSLSSYKAHIVILCFQCEKYLNFSDARYKEFVYLIDGIEQEKTTLVFLKPNMPVPEGKEHVLGVQSIAVAIEKSVNKIIYVHTSKEKNAFSHSLFQIDQQTNIFDVLCEIDPLSANLKQEYGTQADWEAVVNELEENKFWVGYISQIFGSVNALELAASSWSLFDEKKKWLYFISLKLFGAKNSWCLSSAIKKAESENAFIREIYRCILELNCKDMSYWDKYDERKRMIIAFGNPDVEIEDYCSMVLSKGKDTIYYLTDLSSNEIFMIFEQLEANALDMQQESVIEILKHIYPDLYYYLKPYNYKNDLLNRYFQEYKYQKVINKIFPEFEELMEEQAVKREFNLLLPSRSEKIEALDSKDATIYFVDAMGVEYLSFIMNRCMEKRLMAYTILCHCELPSITSKNKEFVEVFQNEGATFMPDKNGIKSLDELKHHGKEDFSYENNKLPTYISVELKIIDKVIDKIATRLSSPNCYRVFLLSDHGASRLCVISNKENKHEMGTNGIHSGRCCPKSEMDIQPDCAIDAEEFWVLANYDRFKGGRKANIEVHGGATLEEVVVPIIEIRKMLTDFEISVTSKNITFSRRKKDAEIKIFSKTKLENLAIMLISTGKFYDGYSDDGLSFKVSIPELRKSGDYTFDVYYNENVIAQNLQFSAKNSDFEEKSIL